MSFSFAGARSDSFSLLATRVGQRFVVGYPTGTLFPVFDAGVRSCVCPIDRVFVPSPYFFCASLVTCKADHTRGMRRIEA